MLVAVVSRGQGPGVDVSPWILGGLHHALDTCGLTGVAVELSPATTHRRLGLGRFELEDDSTPEGAIGLDVPGARRPRRIPSAWFGRHLCVVVPCTFVHERRRTDRWTGPVATAWSAIDHACGGSPGRLEAIVPRPLHGGVVESTIVGARIAASVFASVTLVVDASWWAPVAADATSPPELLALDRCLCLASPVPDERWAMRTIERADAWIASRLRLEDAAGARAHDDVHVVGSAADRAWPRASFGRPLGLAEQAMEALWAIGGKRASAPAVRRLPPAVPGPLARHWHGGGSQARRSS